MLFLSKEHKQTIHALLYVFYDNLFLKHVDLSVDDKANE